MGRHINDVKELMTINQFKPTIGNNHPPMKLLSVPVKFETLQSKANVVAANAIFDSLAMKSKINNCIKMPTTENITSYTIQDQGT